MKKKKPEVVEVEIDYYGEGIGAAQAPPKTFKNPYPTKKPSRPGPLDQVDGIVLGHHVKKVFCCWIVLFGLVGAQMGWGLRPFIGAPNKDFSWFRVRDSNFFEAVANSIYNLMF